MTYYFFSVVLKVLLGAFDEIFNARSSKKFKKTLSKIKNVKKRKNVATIKKTLKTFLHLWAKHCNFEFSDRQLHISHTKKCSKFQLCR